MRYPAREVLVRLLGCTNKSGLAGVGSVVGFVSLNVTHSERKRNAVRNQTSNKISLVLRYCRNIFELLHTLIHATPIHCSSCNRLPTPCFVMPSNETFSNGNVASYSFPPGIHVPSLTWFKNDSNQEIDWEVQEKHFDFLISSGLHGIVIAGRPVALTALDTGCD